MSHLMLFVLISLVEYEVERSREPVIVTVVAENGAHRDLKDNTNNNKWPAE